MTVFLLVCAAIICGAVFLSVVGSFLAAAYMAFMQRGKR
jgi:hypothetical protein